LLARVSGDGPELHTWRGFIYFKEFDHPTVFWSQRFGGIIPSVRSTARRSFRRIYWYRISNWRHVANPAFQRYSQSEPQWSAHSEHKGKRLESDSYDGFVILLSPDSASLWIFWWYPLPRASGISFILGMLNIGWHVFWLPRSFDCHYST
jgi:hypothetical protein